MRKTFLTPVLAVPFALALWGISSTAFAAGSCSIKEAPSPALRDYLKGVDTLLSSIMETGGKGDCGNSGGEKRTGTSDAKKASNSIVGSVNRALNTGNVMTSFRYTVNLIRRTELPAGIRRDHGLLDAKQAAIIGTMDSIYANCGDEQVFSSNVSPYPPYDTEGKKVGEVLEDLLANHTEIMKLYRETVLGDEPKSVSEVSFAPSGFVEKLEEGYGPEAIAACNTSGEGTFFDKVKKAIDRIGKLGDVMERGTQDWKEGKEILLCDMNAAECKNSEKNQRRERELLREELSRQGLSTKASDRMVRNLDAYNRGEGWQGAQSSLQGIGEAVNNGVEAVKGLYNEARDVGAQYAGGGQAPGQPSPEKAKNSEEYLERLKNLTELKTSVGTEIQSEYLELLALVSDENVSVDNNLGQLVEMHVILSKTLKAIDPYRETSTKACNEQARNYGGNCRGE